MCLTTVGAALAPPSLRNNLPIKCQGHRIVEDIFPGRIEFALGTNDPIAKAPLPYGADVANRSHVYLSGGDRFERAHNLAQS